MTNADYWKKREEEAKQHYLTEESEILASLNRKYNYLQTEIEKEINGFYAKYAKAEGLTMAEAQQAVSKMDVQAFAEKARRYVKTRDFSPKANAELKLYNATMKINRLELLKANIGLEIIDAFNEIDAELQGEFENRAMEEFDRQAGILGDSVKRSAKNARAIVNASFHHATFSERIWMYQKQLKNALDDLLTNGIVQGYNPRVLATHLVKAFGASRANAERLMRTEMARVQTEAQKQSFDTNGFDQYVFLALGNACEICKAIDGEVFSVKDMQPGENAPPMHPNCRCSTAAYMDRAEVERELFGENNDLQNSEDIGIIQAGGKGSADTVKRFITPEERAAIIREASQTKDAIYSEDLRRAYYSYGVKPKDDLYDVVMHGTPTSVEYEGKYSLLPQTLAYIIRARNDYAGHEIRLISCNTGVQDSGGKCIAQELANILGVRVWAPKGTANINPDGSITVGKNNLPEEEGFKWFDPKVIE